MATIGSSLPWLKALAQPQWIAAAVSVTVHGVLFAVGPSVSSLSLASADDTVDRAERTVPLIELTPEEQANLPAFATNNSLMPGLGLEAFEQGDPYSLFSDPNNGNGVDTPSTPLRQDSSPLGGSDWPPPSPFDIGIAPYSETPVPTTPAPGQSPSTPPATETPSPGPRTPPATTRPPASTPTPTPRQTPGTASPSGRARDLDGTVAAGSHQSRSRQGTSGSTSTPATETPAQGNPEALISKLQRYNYSPDGTAEAEVEAALEDWTQAVRDAADQPELQPAEPIEVSITYSRRVCLSQDPHDGLVGVLVAPGGEIVDQPQILKSTGYPFLNERVQAFVAEQEYSDIEDYTAYLFEFQMSPETEDCVDPNKILESQTSE
ncbi:uncharacterized protein XM38_023110 [Halomicronema hongdechloris C2206]|uniref:Uncharacterized protein n=1 Tax=Halomicronema hongdechloris C2206 TaxID=1641165 RepID=A0A1Z3HM15_9CYAN|nr:hypothetical protein [Halomicronema hongdechloris]ASC71359.1 uncharacterized protein XM38_023110 [Halomicronema hongdechloris C2206]